MDYESVNEFKLKTKDKARDMIMNDFPRVRNYTNWEKLKLCTNFLLVNFEYNSATETYSLAMIPELPAERPSVGRTLLKNMLTPWKTNFDNYSKEIIYIYPNRYSVAFLPSSTAFNIRQVDILPLTENEIHPAYDNDSDDSVVLRLRMALLAGKIGKRELLTTERKIQMEVQSYYNKRSARLEEVAKKEKEEKLDFKPKDTDEDDKNEG